MGTETEIAAGRALDVFIATEVMGWTATTRPGYLESGKWNLEGVTLPRIDHGGGWRTSAAFSTTYEGMGLVLDRMRELGWEWSIGEVLRWLPGRGSYSGPPHEREWGVFLLDADHERERDGIEVKATTLSHAVCLAALKAVRSVSA